MDTEKCACKGVFLDKLIQPAILVLLTKKSSYGYAILSELTTNDMVSDSSLDPSGFYRTLKKMESSDLIASSWDLETNTKPRRIFTITEEGSHCLKNWYSTLVRYRRSIDLVTDAMLEYYPQLKEPRDCCCENKMK